RGVDKESLTLSLFKRSPAGGASLIVSHNNSFPFPQSCAIEACPIDPPPGQNRSGVKNSSNRKGKTMNMLKNSDVAPSLMRAARRTEATAARMEAKHTAYFAAWDKELPTITYEAIRTRSEQRRDEVAHRFDTVDQSYHEAQTVVQPVIDYFVDIRRALSADLT